MKATELMIGDYLRVNRDGLCIPKGKIVRVTEVDSENYFLEKGLKGSARCEAVGDPWLSGGIWCDYLDPIPITPEILEKNGFEKQGFPGWEIYTEDFLILWRNDYPDILEIWSFNAAYGSFHRSHIGSVHELQHCLKLVGIEKEITL